MDEDEQRDEKGQFKKGCFPYKWNGGKMQDNGYLKVLSKSHPYRDRHGYVCEHRLIMEKHLGRVLLPTEEVHHINGIRNDNRVENLMLFTNHSKHHKFHYPKGSKIGKNLKKGSK